MRLTKSSMYRVALSVASLRVIFVATSIYIHPQPIFLLSYPVRRIAGNSVLLSSAAAQSLRPQISDFRPQLPVNHFYPRYPQNYRIWFGFYGESRF